MEKNPNKADADVHINIPLLDAANTANEEERSDSFIRRSTFIPSQENDHSLDEQALIAMGFDSGMVRKVHVFLKPNNINEAIELMTEVNGIYQHDYYESRASSNINHCYICKKERQFHRDYEEEVRRPVEKFNPFLRNRFDNNVRTREFDTTIYDDDDHPYDYGYSWHDDNNNSFLSGSGIGRKSDEECLICLENFNVNEGNRLPCGHFCCENCLFNYLKTEIQSAKVAKLQCFVRDCDYVLTEGFILGKLKGDKSLIEKYKVFKQRANIFLDKDKKFCPEPDCNSYLQKGKDKYVQCENGHKYCYVCLKKWHGKEKCDEELDKDFQIWKKNKIVKQCPRCKIYTEKNEGCNHMTCTECKYQWCWLCEGEYNEGHFSRGTCNGLQFAKINYLSEKNKVQHRRNVEPPERQTGCCLCVSNIQNKFEFWTFAGPFGHYHGNKCLEFFVSLMMMLFFFMPTIVVTAFHEIPDNHERVTQKFYNKFFAILIGIALWIVYQFLLTVLIILYIIITLPFCQINIISLIENENDYVFEDY